MRGTEDPLDERCPAGEGTDRSAQQTRGPFLGAPRRTTCAAFSISPYSKPSLTSQIRA